MDEILVSYIEAFKGVFVLQFGIVTSVYVFFPSSVEFAFACLSETMTV